jgi:large subunit ribosomal protein L23
MKVLLAPVISEKATFVAEKNEQVVFLVTPDATKPEIKAAVEMLFKVEVESVQVANRAGKVKAYRAFHSVAVTTPVAHSCRLKAGSGNQLHRGG